VSVTQDQLKKVTVSMMNAVHDLPLLVARDEGFFKDEGLDVTILKTPGTGQHGSDHQALRDNIFQRKMESLYDAGACDQFRMCEWGIMKRAVESNLDKDHRSAKIVALGLDALTEHIRTIGLYRNKAKMLMETCRILLEQHGGQVPRTREALEALPGVGRKTANVVLNVAFGESTLAVDTHVFRVSNRTGLAPGETPIEVELRLMKRVPAAYLGDAHHWLILHGRYVCLARRPLCERCAVARWCDSAPSELRGERGRLSSGPAASLP